MDIDISAAKLEMNFITARMAAKLCCSKDGDELSAPRMVTNCTAARKMMDITVARMVIDYIGAGSYWWTQWQPRVHSDIETAADYECSPPSLPHCKM